MDTSLAVLASELIGLESARQRIQTRIDEIQGLLAGGVRSRAKAAPAPVPISDAKRLALVKARATLAKKRKAQKRG